MKGMALVEQAGMQPEAVRQRANRQLRTKRGWQEAALVPRKWALPDSSQKDWQPMAEALLQGSQTDSPWERLPLPWAVVPPPVARSAPPRTGSWGSVQGHLGEALLLGKVILESPQQQASSKMAKALLAESPRMETEVALERMEMADFPALPWLGRSIPAVWPLAAAPCVDPVEKSGSETALDTHDTAQTPATPLGRCAARFQAAQAATPAVARLAKPRHEPLQGANVQSRPQLSAVCWWERPH
jgi:hypothetical protein